MGNIAILDELTSCKIAAGEVVERPASVVKEMAENSIDAGATRISVEIRNGGIKYIRVDDNGCGFEPDDVEIAFEKHATSKIRCGEDLFDISTLGFRGEALASIAAVSRVTLKTKQKDKDGVFVVVEGGEIKDSGYAGCRDGSSFTVENLFYNTPARYKFLKKDQTEAGYVSDCLEKIALAHPEVSVKFINERKQSIFTPGTGKLSDAIFSIYGRESAENLREVVYEGEGISVEGYVSGREFSFRTRARQLFFVNGRAIKSKILTAAVDEAYKTLTMKDKYPMVILKVTVNPSMVDVNVHPAKTEVRFSDESRVFKAIYAAVQGSLYGAAQDSLLDLAETAKDEPVKSEIKVSEKLSDENNGGAGLTENKSVENKPAENISSEKTVLTSDRDFNFAPRPIVDVEKDKNAYESFSNIKKEAVFQKNEEESEGLAVSHQTDAQQYEEFSEISEKEEAEKTEDTTFSDNPKIKPIQGDAVSFDEFFGIKSEESLLSENTKIYRDGKVIGCLFDTYIMLEYDGNLCLIDQHAAHERLMFERIKKALCAHENPSQMLLPPITMKLSPSEMTKLSLATEFLEKLGFEIDDFGGNTIIVRAVPLMLVKISPEEFIITALENIDKQSAGGINVYSDNAVYTMACKAAIKANHRLSDFEIRELLKDLIRIDNPGTCPHGRPILTKFSKYEIERKFHRC